FSTHDCKDFCSLKKADIDKMHHAKEIILKQLYNPCSLIDLARQIGTNEFTLKKGFKEVFGTTVFGMVSDIRMEEAKALLLSGEKNVTEISELIGYKHPAHFNTAFKKKFGITPGKFLK
ncbi:MAG: AraC family transcriptional regulator, partial [Bacteroidetes bacterium]|nr:AraC family transcriptional regulator [Bacteroidota bacterium]